MDARHRPARTLDHGPDPLAAGPHDAEAALAGAVAGDGAGPRPGRALSGLRQGPDIRRLPARGRRSASTVDAPLGLARADDAPPYFTILIVGHIVIPAMLIMQKMDDPPTWLLSVIFVPLTLILAIGLIRPIKGATVGLMLSFNMLKSDAEIG